MMVMTVMTKSMTLKKPRRYEPRCSSTPRAVICRKEYDSQEPISSSDLY